jgi:enoyl-CoA hydratase/carnithine racemase
MTGEILSARDGGVGWLTFSNEAKRNAISLEMWQQLADVMQGFADDPTIAAVVMRGAGEKAFVSGADISQFDAKRNNAEAAAQYSAIGDAGRRALSGFPKPLIAMIHGYCLGGGLGIAMMADLRFAASDSQFGIPAANLGIAYAAENVRRLIGLVGPSVAKDILFSARRLDAAEALSVGLVSRVVPPGELAGAVQAYAALLAEKAPLSLRASKAIIDELTKPESARDSALIPGWVKTCFDSADYAEGRKAFAEKRKPVFTGR